VTKEDTASLMSPLGISSMKTGVGENSVLGGGEDMREHGSEIIGDPIKLICLDGGDELGLLKLVPTVFRRRFSMCAINSASMGFRGA